MALVPEGVSVTALQPLAPELSMGLHTAEEMGDVFDAKVDGAGGYSVDLESLQPQSPANVNAETGEIIDVEPEASPQPQAEQQQDPTPAADQQQTGDTGELDMG